MRNLPLYLFGNETGSGSHTLLSSRGPGGLSQAAVTDLADFGAATSLILPSADTPDAHPRRYACCFPIGDAGATDYAFSLTHEFIGDRHEALSLLTAVPRQALYRAGRPLMLAIFAALSDRMAAGPSADDPAVLVVGDTPPPPLSIPTATHAALQAALAVGPLALGVPAASDSAVFAITLAADVFRETGRLPSFSTLPSPPPLRLWYPAGPDLLSLRAPVDGTALQPPRRLMLLGDDLTLPPEAAPGEEREILLAALYRALPDAVAAPLPDPQGPQHPLSVEDALRRRIATPAIPAPVLIDRLDAIAGDLPVAARSAWQSALEGAIVGWHARRQSRDEASRLRRNRLLDAAEQQPGTTTSHLFLTVLEDRALVRDAEAIPADRFGDLMRNAANAPSAGDTVTAGDEKEEPPQDADGPAEGEATPVGDLSDAAAEEEAAPPLQSPELEPAAPSPLQPAETLAGADDAAPAMVEPASEPLPQPEPLPEQLSAEPTPEPPQRPGGPADPVEPAPAAPPVTAEAPLSFRETPLPPDDPAPSPPKPNFQPTAPFMTDATDIETDDDDFEGESPPWQAKLSASWAQPVVIVPYLDDPAVRASGPPGVPPPPPVDPALSEGKKAAATVVGSMPPWMRPTGAKAVDGSVSRETEDPVVHRKAMEAVAASRAAKAGAQDTAIAALAALRHPHATREDAAMALLNAFRVARGA